MRLDITKARRLGGGARRRLLLAVTLAASVAGCSLGASHVPSGASGPTPEPDALRVVTTTTVFADLVREVGGSRVAVHSLVPRGGEVHTFDPTPTDARRVTEADLIVMNGLGLDDWLGDLARDAGATAPVVALAVDLPGVEYLANGEGAGGSVNPHLWLDVTLAGAYVGRIEQALAAADPADTAAYAAGAATYRARLADLDGWVRSRMATIGQADRRVVSFHDAFPYYAAAYGLEVVGTVVDAPGQDPSAGQVADLVKAIRDAGVGAILSEVQFSDELARTIADETGAEVVSDLYTDTLGDAPVDTYEGLIRWDTDRIVAALQ